MDDQTIGDGSTVTARRTVRSAAWAYFWQLLSRVAGGCAATIVICISAEYGATLAHAETAPTTAATLVAEQVRLPGHTLPAIAAARLLGREDDAPMDVTLTLKRDDQAGFERYLAAVYDAASPRYRRFLSRAELTRRFGPSQQSYDAVLGYLASKKLQLTQGSVNHLTITVRGQRADVESAFDTQINAYGIGERRFRANSADPMLPAAIAGHVQAVVGLSNYARASIKPASLYMGINSANQCYDNNKGRIDKLNESALCAFAYGFLAVINDLFCIGSLGLATLTKGCTLLNPTTPGPAPSSTRAKLAAATPRNPSAAAGAAPESNPSAAATSAVTAIDGTGQKIGLVEFDNFNMSDVQNFLTLTASPASMTNLTEVNVGGGTAIGADESEVLLDIDTVMTLAPGAKVAVYDAPFKAGTSFQSVFNAMINDGVTVISNSWAYCEDQTTLADVQSIDSILQTAAGSGISVFTGSGDSGGSCLDGSANTVAVPADSPNITAVGGTSTVSGVGGTYQSETWWDGVASVPATGAGGFGTSRFFARPSYQATLVTGAQRSVPDVVTSADPATSGVPICQADAGGCPTGLLFGGTSMSAPIWAAYAALFNQAQGKQLGAMNKLLYPLAGTNAFHSAASMGSDFAHVGLGSPNASFINIALRGSSSPGTPVAALSAVSALPANPPADGTTTAAVIVQLRDANGAAVSGKSVTLTAGSASHATISPATATTSVGNGSATFTVTDSTPEALTFTATDSTDGLGVTQTALVTFAVPPAVSAGISANPATVAADGQTAATVTVTLKDSLSRPTPGKTVTLSNGGANAVMAGPVPGVTDANGQISFLATDLVTETVTFTALDVTDGDLPVPGSAAVDFTNAATTSCNFGVAPAAASGFTVTPFLSGFPAATSLFYSNTNFGCTGANNPTFESNGTVLAIDFLTGGLYQSAAAGGSVSTSNLLTTLHPAISALLYGKDGSLYASQSGEGGYIAELDPTTGAQLRVIASGLTCPAGLAIDPLSGDLFFDDECTNGGTDDPTIYRIIDPANTDASRPTSVVAYATLPTTPNGGMAFAPNGTLYAVSGYYYSANAQVEEVSGTNAATVTVTPVTGITSDFAVAIGQTNADGSAQSLIAEPAGTLSEIPIATPGNATVIATGGPGVGVIGPDGCLYSAHGTTIYRISNTSGPCAFTPTSPAPAIKLTPASVAPNPAQGAALTLTATLQNVTPLAGVPVLFTIAGANTQVKLVTTSSTGVAVLKYTGAQAGVDHVTAGVTASSAALNSNTVAVTWTAGQHVTFLTLNPSPQGTLVNKPVTVVASLTDASSTPTVALSGRTVSFTLDGGTCTATTNSAGLASCTLTPSQPGSGTLAATFAGNTEFSAASTSIGFHVSTAPTPPPTVTIAVSPTSIAAGSPATLSWSSTNATGCTASGAWTGTEPTSGTQTVTPAAGGSYSYTLTCTGDGGSVAATAVLAATLVAVTVTAHSGGGAIGWPVLLVLGLLLWARIRSTGGLALKPAYRRSAYRRSSRRRSTLGIALLGACLVMSSRTLHADPSAAAGTDWLSPFYVGVRAGSMPTRASDGRLEGGLASMGYPDISADVDTSSAAGTIYLGYEIAPHADVEFAYTHRSSRAATLTGTLPSADSVPPLLATAAGLIRGYGDVYALSFRPRFEFWPDLTCNPRIGPFLWSTKVTEFGNGQSFSTTHEGGGITAGLGAAYHLWRGLEVGIGVDYFRGMPANNATLYSGSLEWRFGH